MNSKFRVVKCRKCGLKSLFPLPDEDDMKEIYSNYYIKSSRAEVERRRVDWYKHKLELLSMYATGKSLLDIGAGIGTFLTIAKRYGFSVTGIEQSDELCKIANTMNNLNLINAKIEDIRLPMNSFDIVNMNHVLEHLVSPMQALINVYNWLKPGGILLIEVPNQFDNIFLELKYIFIKGKIKPPNNPIQHCYYFSPRTLKLLVRKAGFKILEINQIKDSDENSIKCLIKKSFASIGFGVGNFIEILARK